VRHACVTVEGAEQTLLTALTDSHVFGGCGCWHAHSLSFLVVCGRVATDAVWRCDMSATLHNSFCVLSTVHQTCRQGCVCASRVGDTCPLEQVF
jgi:hypothetical protein